MENALSAIVSQLQDGDVVLAIALLLLITGGGWLLLRLSRAIPGGGWGERYAGFAWQVGALLGMEQAYEFTRGQIPHNTDIALIHAYRLLDLEWRHGLFVEYRLERFFLQFHTLMNAIDLYYVICHVAVTIGGLVWIYTRRRRYYPFARNMFMITTGIALIAFYLYPTAPPRMLWNYGFADPLQLHNLVSAGGAQPNSYTYDPYAAMPSLHVAYALVVAWALFLAERRLVVRLLAVLYPFVMAAVVVISGNHWLLDVVGAFMTVAASWLVLLALTRGSSRLQTAVQSRLLRRAEVTSTFRASAVK